MTPYYAQGGATIDVTTGLGYPKKADDAQRNPRVALLFSDPTGSGIDDADQVLVQGTAEVDDHDLDANRERYWRESWAKLPGIRDAHPPRLIRGLFGWYYTRIYVKVTARAGAGLARRRPDRRAGDLRRPPRGGSLGSQRGAGGRSTSRGRAAPRSGTRASTSSGPATATAVISWVGPDGFPLAVRLPVAVDRGARRIALGAEPAGLPLAEGRACLTAHSHDERFRWQENFQVRGDLVRDASGWSLAPHRMVGGFELPNESEAARYRRNLSKVIRFYRNARARKRARATA